MRLKEDTSSWKSSGILRRDFRHVTNGPEVSNRPTKSRKNTKLWCKGVIGRKHKTEIRFAGWAFRGVCEYFDGDKTFWICGEQEVCKVCGKILRLLNKEECSVSQKSNSVQSP